MVTKPSAIGFMFLCTVFTSIAQVLYKFGANRLSFDLFAIITNYYLYAGLFLYFFAFMLMIKAFKRGEVIVLYPIVSTSYIWVSIMAIIFFKEVMTIFKWAGVLGIISGIIIINLDNKKNNVKYAGVP